VNEWEGNDQLRCLLSPSTTHTTNNITTADTHTTTTISIDLIHLHRPKSYHNYKSQCEYTETHVEENNYNGEGEVLKRLATTIKIE
jgi:hypothetical protein